ncbi:MAG: chemotaxis protein CheX [bacterium]|nr:chemotaxis protein CheX [bacterium]
MSIDNSTLRALVDAATDTLSTMAMLDLKQERCEPSDQPHQGLLEITTFVGLVHDGVENRMLALSLSSNLARTIVASMLGEDEVDADGPEILGDIGELGNMVAGRAKKQLSETPDEFALTLPKTIRGDATTEVPFQDGDHAEVASCEAAGEPIQIALWSFATPR